MLKVVVVEDEELVRKGIVLTVDWAGAGCAVVGEAANGEEGLEVIRRYRPDLIVTDIRMPKLDGIEMLRRLREEGNRAHVVFLTAYSDFSYAQSALKLGAADYLLKPFHDGELEETIARIRNPIYNEEKDFLQKEFGLSMIINPELTAANEIAKVFQFPSAIRVDTFAKGRVELLHFKIGNNSPLCGLKLSKFHATLHCNDILVCTIARNSEEVIIPNGDFEFAANDIVSIVAKRRDAIDFFRKIGLEKNRVSNTIIAGGGKISYYLAKSLLMSGIKTTIIEINQQRCEFLSEQLPKATILCGDATDKELLSEECIEKAAGFAALTDLDEENILLSLYANGISSAKTVTKVNRINFTSVINKLDLGSIIYPRVITAEYIIKYVRSMNNSLNSNVEALYKLEDGKAEVLEFLLKENSAVCNIPLQNLKIRKNTLICCIYRNHQVIVPSGQDCMMPGDSVMIATSGYNISDIKEILED